jgi:dynamin 1-like protein
VSNADFCRFLSFSLLLSLVVSNRGEEWGEFLHLPGQKFFDFDEIRNEIVRETDRVTGRNKGISNKSINLKIFSPYVLNLTLVDLPGITKVPTGDQPEDIEEQIRAMCLEFASNPNAIILAVTAANQDLANSDGLKMARAVDPDGERTIGVLTKIDIMDHGTDCCDVLNNQVIPLKRGYIAVRNRSQKDIQENLPIRKGLQNEQDYFQKHPAYRNLLTKCGTKNLARTLSQMLMVHIRDCLPEIKTKISKMLVSVQTNLDAFGDSIDDLTPSQKGVTLLRLLSQFSTNLSNRVDGKGSTEAFNEMSELYGGARINFIFNEIFGKRLRQLDPFEGLDDDDIRTAIANANGIRPSLFVPEIAFDLLVRRQIARLEQPGLQCVDFVVEELQKMISQSETMEMHRFPELRDRVIDVSYMLLKRCVAPTSKMISNLISIELAYINTSHPDFIGGKAAVNAATQNRARVAGPGVPGPGGVIPPPNGDIPIATSAVAVPGMNLGSEKGYQGVFQSPSGAIKAGSMAGSSSAFAKPSSAYDDKGIKLAQVPDRMRCSALPTERER